MNYKLMSKRIADPWLIEGFVKFTYGRVLTYEKRTLVLGASQRHKHRNWFVFLTTLYNVFLESIGSNRASIAFS